VTVAEVVPQDEARGASFPDPPRPTIVHMAHPRTAPLLGPGDATYQLDLGWVPRDEQVIEYVFFTFTDARGARRQRLESEQPEPQVN
jgi:hypothetical protein